ncbi:hypothetical protein [Marivirga lumbricoides]
MTLSLISITIDKYFGFQSRLNSRTKKKLINKLSESITKKDEKK